MNIRVRSGREALVIEARTAIDELLENENLLVLSCNGVNIPLDDRDRNELWDLAYRIACEAVADSIEIDEDLAAYEARTTPKGSQPA